MHVHDKRYDDDQRAMRDGSEHGHRYSGQRPQATRREKFVTAARTGVRVGLLAATHATVE